MNAFSSATYWERRYQRGGTSGAGSQGRLAAFKASFINMFVAANEVTDVIDLGCGDGTLASMLHVPDYLGLDISPTTLARCRARYSDRRFGDMAGLEGIDAADLALSIDVIFHLVEDEAYIPYMQGLFDHARRYVLIYSSNARVKWASPHVRHRRFTDDVATSLPDWRLVSHVPNVYPFDPKQPHETSFADFFVYARSSDPHPVLIPDMRAYDFWEEAG